MFASKSQRAKSSPPFTEVYREHAPVVWRNLRRLGVAERDIEDVCQEVFLIVFRKIGSFEGRSTLRTWIQGIALRRASEYRRRAVNRREIPTSDPEPLEPSDRNKEHAGSNARQTLDKLLDLLDEEKRTIFVLYELEEMKMVEVSEIVGCPVQTGYSRLQAARRIVEKAAEELSQQEEAI